MKTSPLLPEAALLMPLEQTFPILMVGIIWKKEVKGIIYLGGFINRGPVWL